MSARAGRWALETARQREWEFVRKARAPIALLSLGTLAAVLAYNWALHGWLAGFVTGSVMTALTAGGVMAVRGAAGTTPPRMGAEAERWTTAELHRYLGIEWTVFDHVSFDRFDVDHVVIGPGGIFAVETKWSARSWRLSPPDDRIGDAADQAGRAAERVSKLLRSVDVKVDVSAQPLLVLWGSTDRDNNVEHRVLDVEIVPGRRLANWCSTRRTDLLPRDATNRAEAGIRQFIAKRDAYDQRADRRTKLVTVGFETLSRNAIATVLAACCGMLTALEVLALPEPRWLTVALAAWLCLLGAIARRHKPIALPALGWTTGIALGALCVLAASSFLA